MYALDIAGGFKQQGNDYFKGKRYREALGFYDQAIDAKPDDKALLESLFLNRAACNLELREYIILTTFPFLFLPPSAVYMLDPVDVTLLLLPLVAGCTRFLVVLRFRELRLNT